MVCYFYRFSTNVKGRWVGRSLLDVMSNEFMMKPVEYYKKAIKIGAITVDNKKSDEHHVLALKETVQHLVHYHEPEVSAIQIISVEKDYIVVNKSAGIACHPTSGYNYFSVTKVLDHYGNLSCINRLDVLTSGILILAYKNAAYYHKEMANHKIKKIYLAKVLGYFDDTIEVTNSLKKCDCNVTEVSEIGKKASTVFKRIFYHKGHSLVECRPLTGRSHQIRVHLKSIGFPIVNDPVYNDAYCESGAQKENNSTNHVYKLGCNTEVKHDVIEQFAIENCKGNNTRAFRNKEKFICLHAYKYIFDNKEFVAEIPSWALKENF